MAKKTASWDDYEPTKNIQKTSNKPINNASWDDYDIEKKPETKGWKGIGEDIKTALSNSPETLKNIALAAPEEIIGATGQALRMPYEAGKFAQSGFNPEEAPRITKNVYKGMFDIANTIPNIAKYLGKKGILNQNVYQKLLEEEKQHQPMGFGLGEQQAGDIAAQLLPGLLTTKNIAQKATGYKPNIKPQKELENITNAIESTKQSHAQQLGEGQEHAADISKALTSHFEGKLKNELGGEFNAIDELFANKKVKVPLEVPSHQINNLISIAEKKGYMGDSPNSITMESFKKQAKDFLLKGKREKEVDAQSLYRKFRTLTMQATDDKSKAFAHGIDPESSYKWQGIAAAKQAEAEKIQNQLQDIDPEAFKRLKNVKERWSKEYAPLRENPLYNEMIKHGQTSKDIMKYLHGTTKGNAIINALIEKNPELQLNIVGQKFASKPQNMTKESKLLNKYAQLNPAIARLIEEQKNIKGLEKNRIPEIEKAIEKANKKRESFKNMGKGAGLIGAGILSEEALGRDWKKDFPALVNLLTAHKLMKK